MNEIEQALQELKDSCKPKRKKVAQAVGLEAQQMYFAAHYKRACNKTPHAVKDGHYSRPKLIINDANSLTNAIINFINWSGYNATRISSAGRFAGGKWIPGQTRKGSADITATIKGKSVKLEIKWGKDKPSADQLKEQQRERNAGGVYEFISSFDEFIELYKKLIG